MESGIGLVKGMQSFTSLDFLAADATYGPVGEIRLIPDPETFVVLPYAPRSGQMVVEHGRARPLAVGARPAGLPPADGRRGRRTWTCRSTPPSRTSSTSRSRTDGGYVPVDRSLCFSAIGMESTEPVIQDIIARPDRPGPDGRAVASGARLGPAGAVDPPRAGAQGSRQPDHVPPDGPGRGRPARSRGVACAEAIRRPGGQRRPSPLEHLGRRPQDEPPGDAEDPNGLSNARPQSAIAGVLDAPARAARPHDPERQLVPPTPAALLELRLHRLGHREPRGGRPRAEPLLGRRGRIDESRAQGERREREPVHRAGRRDRRGPRRDRARARPGRPGRRGPRQPDRRRAGEAGHPALPGDGDGGARRAGARQRARSVRSGSRSRRSTSRSAAPRPPRTRSTTRRSSSTSTSSSTDRRPRCRSTSTRSRSSTTTATRCSASSRPTTTRSAST